MSTQHKYSIYPSLIDSFTGWVDSDRLWGEFWGYSENPSMTAEEFEQKQYQSLLNSINRVPIPWEETEAMDRGSAFNEVVDCMILGKKSEKMAIERVYEPIFGMADAGVGLRPNLQITGYTTKVVAVKATYNNRTFTFPISLCREFAAYLTDADVQMRVDAILPTKYGKVLLYGYADAVMPFSIHDIKTTSRYAVGKYRHNWQHIVYPYCLAQMGVSATAFEYNVAKLQTNKDGAVTGCETFTETYNYNPATDYPRLVDVVERLIEFLEVNRDKITNSKIFNIQ